MDQQLRVLFLTLEFSAATFSGNGIYAQSQVRALSRLGHPVFVISGRPRPTTHDDASADKQGATELVQVPVSQWGRLDASAPYAEFASGGCLDHIAQAVEAFRPDVAMVVDWSALQLYRQLSAKLQPLHSSGGSPLADGRPPSPPWSLPMVYLNYRVFSRTSSGAELQLVQRLEREAMEGAVLSVALSRSDAAYLRERVAGGGEGGEGRCGGGEVRVLLPALREDMRRLAPPPLPYGDDGDDGHAAAAAAFARSRPYLSCCVRLSPEKEAERFVAAVEELARRGALAAAGVTPLLVGAARGAYAEGLKARLRAAAPGSVVLEEFMGHEELAEVYRSTRLNMHPATYDAFGMTIVEAASQGAPSLVHSAAAGGAGGAGGAAAGDGAVGATDLLSAAEGEVLLVDLTTGAARVADLMEALLADPRRLLEVAQRACRKARSWSEEANAARLVEMVRQAIA